jgi:hypothetical protein
LRGNSSTPEVRGYPRFHIMEQIAYREFFVTFMALLAFEVFSRWRKSRTRSFASG